MFARLFRSTQSNFARLNKTLLFAAVFLTIIIFSTVQAVAADISEYKTLFQGSTLTANAPVVDQTNKVMSGVVLRLHLVFQNAATADAISSDWDHVAGDYTDGFITRICSGADSTCLFYKIPYSRGSNSNSGYDKARSTTIFVSSTTGTVFNPKNDKISSQDIFITGPGTGGFFSIKADGSVVPATMALPLNGGSITAETWYCATNTNGVDAKKAYSGSDPDIRQFGNLCGGTSYFKIAQTTIAVPQSLTDANAQVATGAATVAAQKNAQKSNLPSCGITTTLTDGTISGCAAQIAYGIYWLTAWVARLFGSLFDFFIGYSLSSASYTYPFVVTGWKLVRDISNIFFIIIMVWTGFSAVFNTSKTSMKSVVPNLIINALLINFSLFATRVVIDISNITARMFYSEMLVCDQAAIDASKSGTCTPEIAKHTGQGYWPLSEKIVSSFNPQKIFSTSILQYPISAGTSNGASTVDAQTAGSAPAVTEQDYAIYFGVVSLIAAGIMVAISIMFFKVTFLFLGRVVGLYICMIFSPFAFLSRNLSMFGSAGKLQWTGWFKDLTAYAMLAPIFVFFLYIIYTLLSSSFVQQIGLSVLPSSGFFETVIPIVIPMLIIFFLLQAAQKAAEESSGTIGKSIQKYGEQLTGMATGTAIGLATGGAGLVGRNLGGRAMRAYGNGLTGKKVMVDGKEVDETRAMSLASRAPNSLRARLGNRALNWGQTSSWDASKAGIKIGKKEYTVGGSLNKGLATYGVKANNLVENVPLVGKDAGKGGILAIDKKRADDKQKKRAERIKFDHLSDEQAQAVWEKYKTDRIEKSTKNDAEKKWKDNGHIDQEPTVKPLATAVEQLQKEGTSLQSEDTALKAEEVLLRQKVTNASTASEATQAENALRENQQKQATNQTSIAANETAKSAATTQLETARKSTIENLSKNDSYKNSAAFADAKAKSTSEEKDRLDKYGKIKNNKMLTAAMQAEYGVDLQANSFWMKDGKMRIPAEVAGAIGFALTGALTAVLPGIGTAVGLAILKNIGEAYGGNVEIRANKGLAGSFKSSQGKGNKEARMKEELDAINEQLEEAMKSLGSKRPPGKISELNDQQIEDGIAAKQYDLEQEITKLREQKAAAVAARDAAAEREHAIDIAKKTKQKDKLDKALSESKRLQNEIDKIGENAKKDAENKKKDETK